MTAATRNMAQFVVPGMHCAGCLSKIERALARRPSVTAARANLSTKRVSVEFGESGIDREDVLATLRAAGFDATVFDPRLVAGDEMVRERELQRALGVAGFATANIMILSVAVWAGLAQDMAAATRKLMHWIAGAIALPAIAYAGRPFFRSAWRAISRRRMNMDVPISLAVLLAAAASLMETVRHGEHVYFDASVALLFFLLIGRFLDERMRGRASEAAKNLLNLRATEAVVLDPDGGRRSCATRDLAPGMRVSVAAGMRLPADGRVVEGTSHIDNALITGESVPVGAARGDAVFAGTLNCGAPLVIEVTARDEDSLLAEIVALMEAAEQNKSAFVRSADRLVRFYAPGVHILAAATFAGWLLSGAGWHPALMAAIAVLIVTCPCALGLAVPIVQVVAAGRLLKRGVLIKTHDALERLAGIDHIVFDKTGTLTGGSLKLAPPVSSTALAEAASLAGHSHHPLARALAAAADGLDTPPASAVEEHAGRGMSGVVDGARARLGSAAWLGARKNSSAAGPELWFARDDEAPIRFLFEDPPRADARATLERLRALGTTIELLSGDRRASVEAAATAVGIDNWRAEVAPTDKIARIEALTAAGHRVLMVGDGLNDAPALAAAHASLSPASASDIAQITADVLFQGERLAPVATAVETARAARRRMIENFALAIGYNLIAVPLAVLGFVTPLIAAIAMSSSSLLVTANALRGGRGR